MPEKCQYCGEQLQVALSRAQATAKELLGETFKGILISDRYPAYNWLDVRQRQVCGAHLKRALIDRSEYRNLCPLCKLANKL